VIGANSAGQEITGNGIESTDLMLRYSPRIARLPGRLSFQANVTNRLNDTGIIPVRLSTSETARNGFVLPGGRHRVQPVRSGRATGDPDHDHVRVQPQWLRTIRPARWPEQAERFSTARHKPHASTTGHAAVSNRLMRRVSSVPWDVGRPPVERRRRRLLHV
jgi:hypothetical protein